MILAGLFAGALFLGLIVLNSYADPGQPDGAPSLSMTPAAASVLRVRSPLADHPDSH